jgi:RNA polymerase sigma-70 factor, ECF subfamily
VLHDPAHVVLIELALQEREDGLVVEAFHSSAPWRRLHGSVVMDDAGTARAIRQIMVAACAARPDLVLDAAAFDAFLRERPERLGGAALAHAGDLALAFACSCGDQVAVRAFDREYLSRVTDLLPARHRAEATEIAQILRDRLLVAGDGGRAKIGDFSGRGGLEGWIRVAAVRVALNLQRSRKREVALDEDRALAERAAGDLEIEHLKERYRREFKEAFTAALGALDTRARTILRQHYLDGLTMEAIGAVYQVHRITVVRWMDQARAALARETRRELTSRLQIDRAELDSILRLIESRVDVTLRAFLR